MDSYSNADLDNFIGDFIAVFRAQKRPFQFNSEKCGYCERVAISYCENCEIGLCADDADSEQYSDVDVCKNQAACEKRFAQGETTNVQP